MARRQDFSRALFLRSVQAESLTVIAGAAKQSILAGKAGLLRRFAPRKRKGSRLALPQQVVEIEPAREHCERAVRLAWPLLLGPVAIKLDAVLVGIAQVKRLADAVIAGAVEMNSRLHHPIQGLGQRCPGRIKDGGVEQSGGPRSRRMAILAFPGVQADVMVIAARRNERRARGQALHQLESQHTAI